LLILIAVVFFTPVAFTACSVDSIWCEVAYSFTSSGGPIGFTILLVLTCLFYASSQPTNSSKVSTFLKAIISLTVFFALLAVLNERYTKHFLKLQRPSHRYMLDQAGRISKIDSLYLLDKETRKKYFETLTRENAPLFKSIDETIVSHWVEEAGYSFPSGHTFNAFLFSMIIAYAIRHTRSRPAWRNCFFIPFLWAILVAVSRVAVGAHTAVDVSVGAALGILVGTIFLKIDLTRYWLTRKDKKTT